jgi:hypothetical protein
MATDTIQFVYSVTTINPPTPEHPKREGVVLDQSIQRCMGGRVTSVDWGAGQLETHVLLWKSLSAADFATLRTFWYTTVGGAANTVTYTDEDATVFSVKYLGGIENARMLDGNLYTVEITLAVV